MRPILFVVPALASILATGAVAQDLAVRDCRADSASILPMVPAGHDAITAHATDDLLGPSIFQRHSTTRDGVDFTIETRRFDDYDAQLPAYLGCETPYMRVTHAQMTLLAEQTEAQDKTRMVPVFFYGWSNGADALVARDFDALSDLSGRAVATTPARLDFALQLALDTPRRNPTASKRSV